MTYSLKDSIENVLQKDDKTTKFVHDFITERYAEPHRHYHTLNHIEDCLNDFIEIGGSHLIDSKTIQAAIWFHDIIYEPLAKDNELKSANLAYTILTPIMGDDFVSKVNDLIMITKHKRLPKEFCERVMVDLDLAILGKDRPEFLRYEEAIRREYHMVPDNEFKTRRLVILDSFLKRKHLYSLPKMKNKYEDRARANLNDSIIKLRKELIV